MAPSSEAPRDLADRVIRQALQHPANLRAFLHQAVPALAGGFDCERGRLLVREFPLDDWRRREADLPFELPYRLGDDELWALVYVLIEHQSGEDPVMPLPARRNMLTGPVSFFCAARKTIEERKRCHQSRCVDGMKSESTHSTRSRARMSLSAAPKGEGDMPRSKSITPTRRYFHRSFK